MGVQRPGGCTEEFDPEILNKSNSYENIEELSADLIAQGRSAADEVSACASSLNVTILEHFSGV